MMDSEFILNDMIAAERKLERLADERRKGGGRDKATIDRDIILFERLQNTLSEEKPLRDIDISADEDKILSGFGFLSRKPVLIVLNLAESQPAPAIEYGHRSSQIVPLQGKLEMDIAQLPPDEMALFLEEYGIEEPSLNRMMRLSYDLLGLQSFLPKQYCWLTHKKQHRVPRARPDSGSMLSFCQAGSSRLASSCSRQDLYISI